MKRFAFLVVLLMVVSGLAAEITYQYTPETTLTWVNGKDQGNFFDPGSSDVTQNLVKMLKVGTLFIDGLPQGQDSGTTVILTTRGRPISITGPFPGQQPNDIRLVAQYFPQSGQRNMIDLTSSTQENIILFPEYKKTSLTMTIWLVIANPVVMTGGSYYVSNLSDYRFELHEGSADGEPISGPGINTTDNPFCGGYSNPIATDTEVPEQPPALEACLSLLSYPDSNPMGTNPYVDISPFEAELGSGVPIAYMRIDFSPANGNAGQSSGLKIDVMHDRMRMHPGSGGPSLDYVLSLQHASSQGTVITESTFAENASGVLSYTLKQSSAGDNDIKRLDFRFADSSYIDAPEGIYSSTVTIILSVV
ncbi:MAG: hypothetical protein ACTTJZ_07235 [Sphaerochaetaceae bacterium]